MSRSYVEVSPSTTLHIDDRYGDVNYYNTASFISLTEDGSIAIGDGYASQILLGGGQIRLEASGDIMHMSGSRVVTLANEAIVRAKGSVDISSSERDVRIKAENNLQILGGNSGYGGVLIESKGQGMRQDYDNKVGEKVQSSGVTLLSKSGSVNVMTRDIYLRSGVDDGNPESRGSIIVDCANGRSPFVCYAQSHAFYNSRGLGIWHQPTGQDDVNIDKSNFFGPHYSMVNGPTLMSKDVIITKGGSLGVPKHILAKGNIQAVGRMACNEAVKGLGDSSKNKFPESVDKYLSAFDELDGLTKEMGEEMFSGFLTDRVWEEKQPGNTTLLADEIGFSFRDDSASEERVYGYEEDSFFMLETRWQQLGRVGLVDNAGDTWTEKPVSYQGNELYPWPGKKNWVDRDAFLQYENDGGFLLFDKGGFSKSRTENRESYEEPSFADWKKDACDATYKL